MVEQYPEPKVKVVYVAGPVTLGDLIVNVRCVLDAGEQLTKMGFVPFLPHLNFAWHLVYPHSWEFWMMLCKEYVLRCDCLLRLPGESKGADIEVEAAKDAGKPVYFSLTDLERCEYETGTE
jgi:hypothetical protein